MTNILFLTSVMKKGHGVSVVIHEIKKSLSDQNFSVHVGAIETDESEFNEYSFKIEGNLDSVRALAESLKIEVLVAVTSPFFELLPMLGETFKTIAYEHGDPSFEFFPLDGKERKQICDFKTKHVYGAVNSTIAISEFIKSDINFNAARVIYNGVNHVPDFGKKVKVNGQNQALKIGTLMRIGAGESLYKGNDLFIDLASTLMKLGNFEIHVMGKGNMDDAKGFQDNGLVVHLNATDDERNKYLRELDIFISPSLWEGFNLPLAEAEAVGTLALAFDTGAHPEVTPFIYGSKTEIIGNILNWNSNRDLLLQDSRKCYKFARTRFDWEKAGEQFADEINNVLKQQNILKNLQPNKRQLIQRFSFIKKIKRGLRYLKNNGIRLTLAKLYRVMRKR